MTASAKNPETPMQQLENGRIALRDYLETCLHSERELWRSEFEALKEATLLQDTINKERFDGHNQFRRQIEEERSLLVRKDDLARLEKELELRHNSLVDKIDLALKGQSKDISEFGKKLGNLDGRWLATTVGGGLLVGVVGLLVKLL